MSRTFLLFNFNIINITNKNNSKENEDELNASKIPKSEFNKNNLYEITLKDNSYFSQIQPDEIDKSLKINKPYNNRVKNNLNDLKEFNSNDNSFAKVF